MHILNKMIQVNAYTDNIFTNIFLLLSEKYKILRKDKSDLYFFFISNDKYINVNYFRGETTYLQKQKHRPL